MPPTNPPTGNRPPAVRLQKLLAQALAISRRRADELVGQGRVSVNGRPAKPGDSATPAAQIALDGKAVHLGTAGPCRVLLYHKPVGEECSHQPRDGRHSVFDDLPPLSTGKWIAVGRLDVTTSGLLLLTTDGALANHLMHPSQGFDREYLVRLQGDPSEEALQRLRSGIELEDGLAYFSDIAIGPDNRGSNRWYSVTLMEGRNRLVHRLWAAEGFRVSRLRRVRFGPLWLPRGLRPGGFSELPAQRIARLHRQPQAPRR